MIKKIFILSIILFMLTSCSLISFTNSNEKNEEKQREIELKNAEELNRKQELEKENRIKELISLYDKGLSKDILIQNIVSSLLLSTRNKFTFNNNFTSSK